MNHHFKNGLLLGMSMLAVVGCSSFSGHSVVPTKAEDAFPIMVDQQTVTMTILVDHTLSDLSEIDKARLSAFVDSYARKGHGPITVTAPSGNSSDYFGQEVAADVRNELNRLGVDWSSMLGATYRVSASGSDQKVIVSFAQYVASASPCGDFSEFWSRNRQNVQSKNFGCSTQNNLAAMISDPRDLAEPNSFTPSDADRQVDAITKYKSGESTTSATEASSSASSTQGGQ